VLAEAVYAALAPFTQHHYDVLVFYYATLLLLQGLNPYDVSENAPWMYSNPVTYPQWYAYPPLGLILFALPSYVLQEFGLLNIFTFRIIEKAVAISAVFWTSRRLNQLTRGRGKSFLLNPLVFFVTAIHGMIDSLAVMLFVEALYRLLKNKGKWWLYYGLSLTTKQTVWITTPALLAYAVKRGSAREAVFSLLISLLISLPFISEGYITNVLTFHGHRPPASLGYTGLPLIMVAGDAATYHVANIIAPCFGKPLPKNGWGSWILSTAFLAFLAYSAMLAYKEQLFKSLAVASLSFLLFSKVISPQNLLVPLVIFEIIGIPPIVLYFFGILAATVDATLGTVYTIFGYAAEDVLNTFELSIVTLYRENIYLAKTLVLAGFMSLILYHVSVFSMLYLMVRNKINKKKFAFIYLIYIVLVLNSVTMDVPREEKMEWYDSQALGKGAVIWLWLNPYNGLKAGDYIFLDLAKGYWEYTFPIALETVRWLKDHGFDYLALVYSLDRSELYAYVPWLFALAKYDMPYVWVVVIPNNNIEYLHGYASYPKNLNLTEVLQKVYRLTPIYLNKKIGEVEKKIYEIINDINVTGLVIGNVGGGCPLTYLMDGKKRAVIFVKGLNGKIEGEGYVALPLPSNITEINNYYEGKVVWGTPVTPTDTDLLSWLTQYAKKSSLYTLLWPSLK